MSGGLYYEPDIILSGKVNAFLHVLLAGRIDNVYWITFPTARRVRVGETRVVIPVIPSTAHWIGLVEENGRPFARDYRTLLRIICGLIGMTDCSGGWRLQ